MGQCFRVVVRFLEHPKFDIPNSRLPILLVWGFEWHVYGNQHKRG